MKVHDTIVHMMKTFPTLNRNRAEALNNLFNGSHAHWVDGELVLDPDSGYFGHDWKKSLRDPDSKDSVHMKLFVLRENKEMEFVVNNAELLAVEDCAKLERNQPDIYYISSYDDRWEDMPDNVKDEWLQAGIEAAWNVYQLTKGAKQQTHAFSSHQKVTQFLLKHGQLKDEDRKRRIKELEEELAKLKGDEE